MNFKKFIHILTKKIKKDFTKDIAIAYVHKDYLHTPESSLFEIDVYFIPKTRRGYDLSMSGRIEGTICNFWVISWERLKSITKPPLASVLTECDIIYYDSYDDLVRFEVLKKNAAGTTASGAGEYEDLSGINPCPADYKEALEAFLGIRCTPAFELKETDDLSTFLDNIGKQPQIGITTSDIYFSMR